jgi:hypothetical protein
MDAKAGTGDQPLAEAEGEDELGEARHQTGDAEAGGVAEFHRRLCPAAAKQQIRTQLIKFFPQFTYIRQSVYGSRAFLK